MSSVDLVLAAERPDVDRLMVCTHEPAAGVPDVRETAERLGVAWTTERLGVDSLPFRPDIIASVYYRHIIAPAIIEGGTLTGVTFHYIDEGIDTGRVLLQSVLPISPDETQASLYTRAADRVMELWPAALQLVLSGFPGIDQEGPTCYRPRGAPCGGEIDDSWSDVQVDRFIRALTSPPYPPARYRGSEVRSLAEYLALRDAVQAR
jgi:methionyl-tRNA formyltransferase